MNIVQPTDQQRLFLEKANNEDVDTRNRDLEIIKEWLRKEPHLPDQFDDHALMNFLRGCKFSLEKTKKKLEMYFTMRAHIPEFFADRDVTRPELSKIPRIVPFAVMPELTPDVKRITVVLSPVVDFCVADTINFAKIILMMGDIRVYTEIGVHDIYILDASIVQLKNISNISVSMIKKFLACAIEAYPVRIKEVHVINSTPFVSLVLKWAARIIKEKIMKRVKIHPNFESLHEFVPKNLLPEECGGTAGKLHEFTEKWMVTLEQYQDWFKEKEKLKADEALRVGREVSSKSLFGVDGSFKQLTVD